MNLFIPFRYRFKQIPHSRRSKTDSLLNSLNRNFTLSLPAKIDSMNILLLVGGLLLILLGANGLTDGAASVAQRFRIPNIVIGLTIVAFGTSAPELTVSVSSALKGSADIAIGNVVGSNIFNTLMIVGCTALFAPIAVTRNTLQKEIPLCILSSIALLVCANDVFLNGDEANILSITDGLLLLCFFAIFLSYTFAIASRTPSTSPWSPAPCAPGPSSTPASLPYTTGRRMTRRAAAGRCSTSLRSASTTTPASTAGCWRRSAPLCSRNSFNLCADLTLF